MAKKAVEVPPWISLDSSLEIPYYRQLYDGMRRAILSGPLLSGTRLPSTRTLAAELGVSRTTVVTAFEGLLAEGYLEGKVGSGTFVATSLPDDSLSVALEAGRRRRRVPRAPSGRGCPRWASFQTRCGVGSWVTCGDGLRTVSSTGTRRGTGRYGRPLGVPRGVESGKVRT
jgi:GntR family transcriptional regulator/MocR family aminotransferase